MHRDKDGVEWQSEVIDCVNICKTLKHFFCYIMAESKVQGPGQCYSK